jgi:hypothetical protein
MRGASSARGTAMMRPISVGGRRGAVGDGVNIDGVGWAAPGLNLLSYFLGVGWGKNAGGASIFERVRERVQEMVDSVRETHRSQNARAE